MKLEPIEIKVKGIGLGLLQNNPMSMRMSPKGPVSKKIPTPEEEAKEKVYKTEDGEFYHPTIAFRACLLNGLTGKKVGARSAIKIFSGCVFVYKEQSILHDPDTWKPLEKYEILVVRACIKGAGILRARPIWRKWGSIVPFEIDTDMVSEEQVREMLNEAGTKIAVGDWRIEKKGQYGRFIVVE